MRFCQMSLRTPISAAGAPLAPTPFQTPSTAASTAPRELFQTQTTQIAHLAQLLHGRRQGLLPVLPVTPTLPPENATIASR